MTAAVGTAAGAREARLTVVTHPPHVRTVEKTAADVVPRPNKAAAGSQIDFESESRDSGSGTALVPTWKRWLDITCVILSLPITLPLMALVATWVRLVSRGPALFRQERVGLNGRRFVIYKFRSMRMNAPRGVHQRHYRNLVRTNSPMVKLDVLCDNRLIAGGCLLRASGLDELPQLINVLRGEMSLVGPRPCLPNELQFFSRPQRRRFETLPGLTGIWQVEGKGLSTFTEMNAMDACYVRRASVRVDLGVMLRTPGALLKQIADAASRRVRERESTCSAVGPVSGVGYPGIG